MVKIKSELDRKIWAVITHDKIIANRVTHLGACKAVKKACTVNPKLAYEITIVTSAVAKRMRK